MPTQTLNSIQQLFNGDSTANVPLTGFRAVDIPTFDRTHANDTNQDTFRTSFRTNEWTPGGDLQLNARFIMPPDRLINTDVYYRWHFTTDAAGAGDVVLQFQISGADVGGTFGPAFSSTQTLPVTTQYEHLIATFGPFGAALEIDGAHFLRFTRLGSDVADTLAVDIYLVGLQAWYQVDRLAVPNYLPPYYS